MQSLIQFIKKYKNYIYLCLAGVAIIGCAINLFCMVNPRYCWNSDVLECTLMPMEGSFFEMIAALPRAGWNLPLYYIIMYPLFKINSTNLIWLSLPSIIFYIIFVVFMGLIGKTLKGNTFGLLCVFSVIIPTQTIKWEDLNFILVAPRPYSLFLCLSSIVLYLFILKIRTQSKKVNILFSVFMALLVMTHWYGILIAAFYGVYELSVFIYKVIKNKKFIFPKNLFAYIAPYTIFFIWFILTLFYIESLYTWHIHVVNVIMHFFVYYWLGEQNINMFFYYVGVLFIVVTFIYNIIKKQHQNLEFQIIALALYGILIIYQIVFAFLKLSVFWWWYFFILGPHASLIFVLGVYCVFNFLLNLFYSKKDAIIKYLSTVSLLTVTLTFSINYYRVPIVDYKSKISNIDFSYFMVVVYDTFKYFKTADIADENTAFVFYSKELYSSYFYFYKKQGIWPKNMYMLDSTVYQKSYDKIFVSCLLPEMTYKVEIENSKLKYLSVPDRIDYFTRFDKIYLYGWFDLGLPETYEVFNALNPSCGNYNKEIVLNAEHECSIYYLYK